jgi:DNA modification methylase
MLKIEYIDINTIKPYKKNAKLHPPEQIEQIKKSIEQFGMDDPIGIWHDEIVEGHGRLIACKELGYTEVPIIRLDHLTDEERKAYTLAHNKLTMNSDFDIDVLNEELENIENIDMSDFGFDIDLDIEEEQEIVEDEVPEVPEEPKAKLGDIYQLGNHRLMCGDSTSIDDITKLLNGNKIDMVYTDAPYGISIVNDKTHKVGAENLAKNKEYLQVKGDDTTDTAKKFYNNCVNIGIDNFILWGGNYFTDFLPFSPSWLIWDKRIDMNSNNFADGEMAWCSFKTPVRIYHQLWNGMIREGEHEDRVHPTQKPIRMQTEILKDFTNESDNILDGFGGSGSTLLACEQTNRNCFMIEYEPSYIDVIIQRWETFTGKKAVKIEGE